MSAIAERIEERLRTLPRDRAAQLEQELSRILDAADSGAHTTPPPYRTRPLLHGLQPGYSYDNVAELLAAADWEDWR